MDENDVEVFLDGDMDNSLSKEKKEEINHYLNCLDPHVKAHLENFAEKKSNPGYFGEHKIISGGNDCDAHPELCPGRTISKDVIERKHNGGAVKFDGAKPRIGLVPQQALNEVAKVMTYGAQKYAPYNWMKGFDYSKLTDAAMRHIIAFNLGENIDPESNLPHLAHAVCCLMMLHDNSILHPELDDRPKDYIGKSDEKKT